MMNEFSGPTSRKKSLQPPSLNSCDLEKMAVLDLLPISIQRRAQR
jgi:hypothetical protein